MRRLLERLQRSVEGFIEQREDLLALVACTDEDAAAVLKVLRGLEQAQGADLFLLFSQPFTRLEPFVSETVRLLEAQHRQACEALVSQGHPALAPFPARLKEETRPALERLRGAVDFARSLLPAQGGHRLVWALVPTHIADRSQWLELINSFLPPPQQIHPWMRGLRVLLREAAGPLPSSPRGSRVRTLRVDLSPAALQESLERQVQEGSLPLEERMQALLSLACLDYAHGRSMEALGKYKLLLGHYQHTGNLALQSLVLHGMGDVHRRAGALQQAQHWYECAIGPAAQAGAPVLLAMVVRSLGELASAQGRYAEAEQYFEHLDRLATHLRDPESKASALEQRGLCQEQRGSLESARLSWQAAADLCRSLGLTLPLRANLEHLRRTLGRGERLRAIEAELKELRSHEHSHG